MNWKRESIEDLRKFSNRKMALNSIKERIAALKSDCESVRGIATNKVPVSGGASHMEDGIINNIVERERLKVTYSAVSRLVNITQRGLDSLSKTEREVLEKFYINRSSTYVDDLCDLFSLERAQIYRIKDDAIYKFTLAMYGIIDY